MSATADSAPVARSSSQRITQVKKGRVGKQKVSADTQSEQGVSKRRSQKFDNRSEEFRLKNTRSSSQANSVKNKSTGIHKKSKNARSDSVPDNLSNDSSYSALSSPRVGRARNQIKKKSKFAQQHAVVVKDDSESDENSIAGQDN